MEDSGTSELEYEPSEGEDTENDTEDKAEEDVSMESITDMSTNASLILNASFNIPGHSAYDDVMLKADLSKGRRVMTNQIIVFIVENFKQNSHGI